MMGPLIVLDTNVLVSALRSRLGASFKILSLTGSNRFRTCLSVPLVVEYEAAGKAAARSVGLRGKDVEIIVDYLCNVSEKRQIYFLWRPVLNDASDDMVLELAVEANADYIVTHNIRDFAGCEGFGVPAITPQEFLRVIGAIR